MRTVTLRATVGAVAWARDSKGGWKLSCSPQLSHVLYHLRASELVGVSRNQSTTYRVVTINQRERVVDDLPRGRSQSRTGEAVRFL